MLVHELLSKLTFSDQHETTKIIVLRLGDVLYDSDICNVHELCQLLNSEVLEFNDHVVQNFTYSNYRKRIVEVQVC